MTRILSIIFLLNFSLVWGQKDTTIYYTKTYRTTPSVDEAFFYDDVKVKSHKEYQIVTHYRLKDGWQETNRQYIKPLSATTYEISSGDKKKPKIIRSVKLSDNGYYITDSQKSHIIQEGLSNLVFPLIREGYWRKNNESTGKIAHEGFYENNQIISNKFWIDDSSYIEDVFLFPDKSPEYEGGWYELSKYVANTTRYPRYQMERGISGSVLVGFVIMKDGSMGGIHLIRGVNPALDAEALRVIGSIPQKWTPGELNNEKVNVAFSYTVNFIQQ